MEDTGLQIRVGVVVLAAAILTGILIMIFGEGWKDQYTVHLEFDQAPGVSVDTPVRKNGVLIGRVSDVKLRDEGGVLITARIDDEYVLRRNEVCRIASASIFGDAILEFVPKAGGEGSTDRIQDGDYLADGVVAGNPLEVLVNLQDDLESATRSIQGAGNDVSLLARNINTVVGDNGPQLQRILQRTEEALIRFDTALATVDDLLGDPEFAAQLKETLGSLPEFLGQARETLGVARETLESFQRVGNEAEANLANLRGLTGPLGERGPELAANVERSLANLDELLVQIRQFTQALNNREGTLARLIYEPELYEKLLRATGNIEDLSQQLRPVLADVRVFSDKLARDPRQLGVKGVLDRRPTGFKEFPGWTEDAPLIVPQGH